MFDFQPSHQLTKRIMRKSSFIHDYSRDVDNSEPGFHYFSGRPSIEKARKLIGKTLTSILVGRAAEASLRRDYTDIRLTVSQGRQFSNQVQKRIYEGLQLKRGWLTPRMLAALCAELVTWLRQQPGCQVIMDRRCCAKAFLFSPSGEIVMQVQQDIPLDDWAKTPATAVSVDIDLDE